MDFSKLRAMAQQEIDENNSKERNFDGPRIFYPGADGSVVLKILYNPKAQILQRKLIRHDKTPCFQIYGEDCPICSAIHQAEESKGKECGAFRKYGYKVRGVAYAVIIENKMKDSDVKPGELVLFMYPVSVYNQINELMVKAGEHLENLIAKNDGNVFELTRKQNNGGFPDYNMSIYPFGSMKVKETDEEFNKLMEELPDLNQAIVPHQPSQEVRDKARATAETIIAEYISGSVMNPNDPKSAETSSNNSNNQGSLANAMNPPQSSSPTVAPTPTQSGDNPECFGQHKDGDNKCIVCPVECECLLSN